MQKGKKEEEKEKDNDKGESQRKWKLTKEKSPLNPLKPTKKNTAPKEQGLPPLFSSPKDHLTLDWQSLKGHPKKYLTNLTRGGYLLKLLLPSKQMTYQPPPYRRCGFIILPTNLNPI